MVNGFFTYISAIFLLIFYLVAKFSKKETVS